MASQSTVNKLYIMRLSVMAQAYRDQGELPGAAGMTFDEGFAMVVDDGWLKMKKRYLKCDLLILDDWLLDVFCNFDF